VRAPSTFLVRNNNIPPLTISIGVAVLPHGTLYDRTATELLERVTRLADDAMYVAKATGRNRVCRATESPFQQRNLRSVRFGRQRGTEERLTAAN